MRDESREARGELEIIRLTKLTPEVLLELETYERKIFGASGLSRWQLPIIGKYGFLFALYRRLNAPSPLRGEGRGEGDLIGLASFIAKKDIAFLIGLWIKNEFRKNGFGEKFLSEAFSELTKTNVAHIELTVQKHNLAARKLYKKMGFELTGEIKDYYGPNQNRLLLSRNLLK